MYPSETSSVVNKKLLSSLSQVLWQKFPGVGHVLINCGLVFRVKSTATTPE